MPTAELADEDFVDGNIDILTMLLKSGLVPSKSEARRAVEQGGVAVDGEKVTDIKMLFAKADIPEDGLVLRRGKKNFRRVVAK
jgi:tyrosyl-tRNA synthetase